MHDIKYMSDGSRLEAPTVLNVIKPTLIQSSTRKIPANIRPRTRGPVLFTVLLQYITDVL